MAEVIVRVIQQNVSSKGEYIITPRYPVQKCCLEITCSDEKAVIAKEILSLIGTVKIN